MKNYLLLLALAVGSLASCKRNEPDPTPTPAPTQPIAVTLEARWQIDSTYETGTTAATRYQKSKIQVLAPGAGSAVFTSTMATIYAGAVVDKQWNYTRNGNTIYRDGLTDWVHTATIDALTAHRLVLSYQQTANNSGTLSPSQYGRVFTTYSR